MVEVRLGGTLKVTAAGREKFIVQANTIYELIQVLKSEHPELRQILGKGVAVSVDGAVYRYAWFQPIDPDSEVFLLPRFAGG